MKSKVQLPCTSKNHCMHCFPELLRVHYNISTDRQMKLANVLFFFMMMKKESSVCVCINIDGGGLSETDLRAREPSRSSSAWSVPPRGTIDREWQ